MTLPTRLLRFLVPALLALASSPILEAAPLRVLVASDAETFRADYAAALGKAGAVVTLATVPDAVTLENVDAVLLHRDKFEALPAAAQAALTAFAQRGGGIVAVHAAVAAGDAAWGRATLGTIGNAMICACGCASVAPASAPWFLNTRMYFSRSSRLRASIRSRQARRNRSTSASDIVASRQS